MTGKYKMRKIRDFWLLVNSKTPKSEKIMSSAGGTFTTAVQIAELNVVES